MTSDYDCREAEDYFGANRYDEITRLQAEVARLTRERDEAIHNVEAERLIAQRRDGDQRRTMHRLNAMVTGLRAHLCRIGSRKKPPSMILPIAREVPDGKAQD